MHHERGWLHGFTRQKIRGGFQSIGSKIPGPYVTFDSVHEELVMRLLAIRTAAGNAERDAEIDDTLGVSIRAPSFGLGKVNDMASMSVKQQLVHVGVTVSEIDGFVVGFGKKRQTNVCP